MFKKISEHLIQLLSITPFTYKDIKIKWNQVDTVDSIIYKGTHISNAINSTIRLVKFRQGKVELPTELITIIEDVLNSIAALPKADQRKKIHVADRLFENLHMDTNPPNPQL